MYLVADIGNTNVCLAVFKGARLLKSWRFETHASLDTKDWAEQIEKALCLASLSLGEMSGFLVSSVVPSLLKVIEPFGMKNFGEAFYIAGQGPAFFRNKALIQSPGEEGADLMINAYGAHHTYGGPLFVVDFGTATTVSRIDEKGNFCGVAIAPGFNLSAEALFKGAENLFHLSFEKPRKVIGTSTEESVRSGLFWGYLGLIEGLVNRAINENKQFFTTKSPRVIATGGLGETFSKETSCITLYDPYLTLNGLALLYQSISMEQKIELENYDTAL